MLKYLTEILPTFTQEVSEVQCGEHNYAAMMYHAFRKVGLSHKQVCREMYCGHLSPDRDRPDIVLMDSDADGLFSNYQNGDEGSPNDLRKLRHLRCLIEIKGGYKTTSTVIGRLDIWVEKYLRGDASGSNPLRDIDKIERWKRVFGSDKEYVFVTIDVPETRLIDNGEPAEVVADICRRKGTRYVHVDGIRGKFSRNW